MNEFSHAEHGFDPQVLDRLVDGELGDGERRVLLESLERQPDGWRQCALAFLEAQAWGQTLTDYVREPAGAVTGVAAQAAALPSQGFDGEGNVPAGRTADGPSDASRRHEAARSNRIRTALAIAGSFLVTFSLGMYAQRYLRTSDETLQTATAQQPAVRYVNIDVIDPNGQPQRVQAPVVDQRFAQLFAPGPAPTAPPPDWVRWAQQRGVQFRYRRDFVPVSIGGGGQALVPYGRFEIVPVSNSVR